MWQKVLWRKQGVPDNYVDTSFLAELRKNACVRLYTWRWLVVHSLRIASHAAAILVFLSFFVFLHSSWVAPGTLIVLANCVTALAYAVWFVLYVSLRSSVRSAGSTGASHSSAGVPPGADGQRQTHKENDASAPPSGTGNMQHLPPMHLGRQVAVSGIIFMMTLLGLTPILKTLTEDTSSDTIWALSAACFIANFVFHDYASVRRRGGLSSPALASANLGGYARSTSASGSSAYHAASAREPLLEALGATTKRSPPGMLALNAAIFASVMLASRLPTKAHVYGLMSLAVDWFALLPVFQRAVASSPESPAGVAMSLVLIVLAFAMLASFSRAAASAWLISVLAVTLVLPYVYVRLQRYKNEIHGPWDEASVTIRRRV